jgi:hypothetical protein
MSSICGVAVPNMLVPRIRSNDKSVKEYVTVIDEGPPMIPPPITIVVVSLSVPAFALNVVEVTGRMNGATADEFGETLYCVIVENIVLPGRVRLNSNSWYGGAPARGRCQRVLAWFGNT